MQKPRIDADTWAALNQLLDEALDQPADTREAWIEKLAPQFAGLKPRLRGLLSRAVQIESADALNTLPKLELDPGDLAQTPGREDQPGDEIGPYRLLRQLGSGGMGVVWLAERTDGLINRPVALKLPHGAWKRSGLAERMAREREILASLAHPNIAHLYDAGITADGQPYLAIEYVEGLRIDVYCRERNLDVRSRLSLFLQVANAVAHAHGRLVVHRDLKPANILINAEGEVRLLDFGIAKLLDDGQTRETRFTEASGRALTPDYASPEQILGEPLTISTDIYSLGVVLYELLSGSRPYKLQRVSRGALEDAIVQAEPAPPSGVADRASQKFLRGDLDTVVLKALKKKPAERYATVHALLDDIKRVFAGRPVQAQPDSRWYRAKRFAGRNKLGFAASSAILLAVLVGAGVAAWQARVAVAEQRRAEQVKEFIAGIFREASPYSGAGSTTLSAIDLLKQAEKKLGTEIGGQPKVRIELLTLIGESLMALGDLDAAEPVLDRAAKEAREALDESDGMAVGIGLLQAQMHRFRGRAKEARAELDRILPALRSDPAIKPLDLAGRTGPSNPHRDRRRRIRGCGTIRAGGRESRQREARHRPRADDHQLDPAGARLSLHQEIHAVARCREKCISGRGGAFRRRTAAPARHRGENDLRPRIGGHRRARRGNRNDRRGHRRPAHFDGPGCSPGRHLPAEPRGLSHRSRRARARGQQRRGGTQDHQRPGRTRVCALCRHPRRPRAGAAGPARRGRGARGVQSRHTYPRTNAGRGARSDAAGAYRPSACVRLSRSAG